MPRLAFTDSLATVKTTDGFDITVAPNDHVGRHIYLSGEFDRAIVEVLLNFSEPGDVLLDIGANVGYVSACFLHQVPGSSVIAVDPQPKVVDLLRANLARFERTQIYPYALGEADGEVHFEINQKNNAASRVVSDSSARTTKVEMRAASRMFSNLKIAKLDLVKIDAEGHDEIILRSCIADIERLKPRAVLFEGNSTGMRRMLSDIGYTVFGIRKHLHKLSLARGAGHYHDCVAVCRSRTVPAKASALYGI